MSNPVANPWGVHRLVRYLLAAVFLLGTVAVLAPVPPPGMSREAGAGAGILFILVLAGAVAATAAYLRGRSWGRGAVLLGMLAIEWCVMVGIATLNNLKYLQDAVRPLASGYLFANVLRIAGWMGMPTRNLVVCILSVGLALAVFLVFPVAVIAREYRAIPRQDWRWIRDLRLVLIVCMLIWNVALIGLAFRPFALGYLW